MDLSSLTYDELVAATDRIGHVAVGAEIARRRSLPSRQKTYAAMTSAERCFHFDARTRASFDGPSAPTAPATAQRSNPMSIRKSAPVAAPRSVTVAAVDRLVSASMRRAHAEDDEIDEKDKLSDDDDGICKFCDGTGRRPTREEGDDKNPLERDGNGKRALHGAELAQLARSIATREGIAYHAALVKAGKQRPDLLARYQRSSGARR